MNLPKETSKKLNKTFNEKNRINNKKWKRWYENSQKKQEKLFIENNNYLTQLEYYGKILLEMVISIIDAFLFIFKLVKTII